MVSTTYSEFSNAEAMRRFKEAQVTRGGKPVIPKYLKEDFPDNSMHACKQLIASLQNQGPPAEIFDELAIKTFKNITANTRRKKRRPCKVDQILNL